MTIQRTCVYVTCSLTLAICILINTNVMARSVCLPQALSFYDSKYACNLKKEHLKNLYDTAHTLRCHFNCSIKSTPSLDEMDEESSYELDVMTLDFNAYDFVLVKSCKLEFNDKLNIDVNCEKKELQDENCNSHENCEKVIINSTCNNTSGVCQCETGHVHLLDINTCKKVQKLGESCIDSRQCKEAIPYSMCSADTYCKCQQGYLELNSSCFPVQQLKESCIYHKQCSVANSNTTCDNLTGVCKCSDGHLEMFNTCFEIRGLGEQCNISRQCMERSPYSMCSADNDCRCQPSYIRVNNSCIPERRLTETCNNSLQCLETTPNSTCHNTTGICECTEGHLMVFETCVEGQRLVDEVCKHFKKCLTSNNNCEQKEIETVCTSLLETFSKVLDNENIYETEKNDNSSFAAGVGVACFLFGVIIGGLVYSIIIWNKRKTKQRSGKFSDDTTEQISVQVSQHMNSRHVYNDDIRDNEEGNDVYIHLHQDPFEVNVQSDYDHAPQQMEDDYSHMNTCNKTLVQEPDDYGELN